MEVKKSGKRLKHVGLSFVLILCLALSACKAEKKEEDTSGVRIGQGQDAAVDLEDGEGNFGETSDAEGAAGAEGTSGAEGAAGAEGTSVAEKGEEVGGTFETDGKKVVEPGEITEPTPSDTPQKTPEEILAEQLIDETHDAFLVEKGGKTGTVLVTAKREEGYILVQFSIWDLNHMEKPIQVINPSGGFDEFGKYMIVDANFDGWADFGYLKSIDDGREYWEFWFWNEVESQFEEKYLGFSFVNPVFFADIKIVSCLDEQSGSGNFYRWQDSSIYDVRSITTTCGNGEAYLSVTDYFGDIPINIFSQSYEENSAQWREQWNLWCDLDYHGEPGSAGDLLQSGIPEGIISAFVIRTGSDGREMLVTAQPCEIDDVTDTSGAQCWYDDWAVRFSVWNPNDMSEPVQTMCKYVEKYHYQGSHFHQYQIVDANFDGYMDFSWICHSGNQPVFYYLWLWDEEQGKFVEEPAYNEISMPAADAQKQIISGWSRSSVATDGSSTFYKWVDGHLLCVRHIFVWREIDTDNYIMTVEDWMDGEMAEVYRAEFEVDWDFIAEREKWMNLDYHGEK